MHGLKENLVRFEALRLILGHDLVLTEYQVMSLEGGENDILVLAAYAEALRGLYDDQLALYGDESTVGVLPAVDMVGLTVSHETCSGNSRYTLASSGFQWSIGTARAEDAPPVDPTDGWQASRAILGGLGAAPALDHRYWHVEEGNLFDPRPAAREFLIAQNVWAAETIEGWIGAYRPDGGFWMAQAEDSARAEESARNEAVEAARILERRKRESPVALGPLTAWEQGLLDASM